MTLGNRLWGKSMYEVVIARDEESGYFYVVESDIRGLNVCAPTLDALIEICDDVIPDLLMANHRPGLLARVWASVATPEPSARINYHKEISLAHA